MAATEKGVTETCKSRGELASSLKHWRVTAAFYGWLLKLYINFFWGLRIRCADGASRHPPCCTRLGCLLPLSALYLVPLLLTHPLTDDCCSQEMSVAQVTFTDLAVSLINVALTTELGYSQEGTGLQ